jgi:hypothetical protein
MLLNRDKKNKTSVLNLERLVVDFKLDIKQNGDNYELTDAPAFVSKSYYEIQNLDKPNKSGFTYNYPPKGPIPLDFICLFCKNKGPSYHKETCKRPFNSSLVLESEGTRFPGAEEGTAGGGAIAASPGALRGVAGGRGAWIRRLAWRNQEPQPPTRIA